MRYLTSLLSLSAAVSALPSFSLPSRDVNDTTLTTANSNTTLGGPDWTNLRDEGLIHLLHNTLEWTSKRDMPHFGVIALSTSSDPKRNYPNWLLGRVPSTKRVLLAVGSPGGTKFDAFEYPGAGMAAHRIFIWPLLTPDLNFARAATIAIAHASSADFTKALDSVVLSKFEFLGSNPDAYYLFRHIDEALYETRKSDAVFVNARTGQSFVLRNCDLQPEEVRVRDKENEVQGMIEEVMGNATVGAQAKPDERPITTTLTDTDVVTS